MNRPINEQDEFLLSRLLDHDLSPDEAADLRARMEREPDLLKAYESISRIDSLLATRRTDQPQIDWPRFHRQVMDQVRAEAGRRLTFRLADFLRVALPLAAAAAIALIVWLWPQGAAVTPGPQGDNPTGQIALQGPEPSPIPAGPAIVVRYSHGRPGRSGAHELPVVRYARSDDLLKQYQAMDHRNRSREPGATLMAGNIRSSQAVSPESLAAAWPLF